MQDTNLFFLDFDGTLFDTKAFRDAVRKTCAERLAVPEERYTETYQNSKRLGFGYDIDTHISLLGVSKEDMLSVFTSVLNQTSYVFPDVVPFFENHRGDTIVILSQGVEWSQCAKIVSLPLNDREIRTIVIDYKKRLYIENTVGFYEDGVLWEGTHYNSLTFVDNMADAFLKEDHGKVFRQYRIRRKGTDAYAVEPTQEGSKEITTLLDI